MPDGSAFTFDLFISYASADNWNPSGAPWVTQFHDDLAKVLTRRLGRAPVISFADTNARRYDAGRPRAATPDAMRSSAVFLAVLSPSYVTTERTISELDAFRNGAAAGSHLVAVELRPVGALDKFPQLKGVTSTRFWKDRGESSVELTHAADAVEYAAQLESLTSQIVEGLTGRPADSSALPPPPPIEPPPVAAPVEPPVAAPPKDVTPARSYPRMSPEYWLHRAAHERKLAPGSDPLVLISYASEDQQWINELRAFLDLSLELLRDPDGRPYQLWSYSDTRRGTSPGDEFPEVVAEKMWRCRAALLVLSTDYFQSKFCRQIELPFLLWRREHHGLMCMPVRLGTLPVNRVRLPEYEGASRTVIFDEMIDDRQAAVEFASSPHRELSLLQLMERNIRSERDDRYQGIALRIADFLKRQHAAVDCE